MGRTTAKKVRLGLEILFVCIIGYQLGAELLEVYSAVKSNELWSYIADFWNLLDWTNLSLFSAWSAVTSTLKLLDTNFLVLAICYILNFRIPTGPAVFAFIVLSRRGTCCASCHDC